MSETVYCPYCGDPMHANQNDCWVKGKFETQETLQTEEQITYLTIGDLPGDAAVPQRVKEVPVGPSW